VLNNCQVCRVLQRLQIYYIVLIFTSLLCRSWRGNKGVLSAIVFHVTSTANTVTPNGETLFKRSHGPRVFYCAEQFRSLAQHKGICDVTLWEETPSRCVNTYQRRRCVSQKRRHSFFISLVIPKGIKFSSKAWVFVQPISHIVLCQ